MALKRKAPEPATIASTKQPKLHDGGVTQCVEALNEAVAYILKSKKLIVIARAGISTPAGVPDYRGERGKYKRGSHAKEMFSALELGSSKPNIDRLQEQCAKAKPTGFHSMMVRLSQNGHLLRFYSQNVDGLESLAGLDVSHKVGHSNTVLLHGTLSRTVCSKTPSHEFCTDDQHRTGRECDACSKTARKGGRYPVRDRGPGFLYPRISLTFGHDWDAIGIARTIVQDRRKIPDVLLVVGTSLHTHGAARTANEFAKTVHDGKSKCGKVVWVSKGKCRLPNDLVDVVLDMDVEHFALALEGALSVKLGGPPT